MKLTNENNLPAALMVAAMSDDYDRGDADISVTELIAPVRHRIMEQAYGDKIAVDVSMRVHAMLGHAVHNLMEHGDEPGDVVKEERLYGRHMGWTISGKIDRVERDRSGFLLTDYKVTSTSIVTKGKEEWAEQTNLYRWLFHETHGAWPRAQIIAFLRDWSKTKADVMGDRYPQAPVVTMSMPLWKPETIKEFLDRRVQLHQDAQALYDRHGEIVECTPYDRWSTGDTYKVIKTGGKRASAVFQDITEAQRYLRSMGQGYMIQKQNSEERRCETFCEYADHCEQWKAIWEGREIAAMMKELE